MERSGNGRSAKAEKSSGGIFSALSAATGLGNALRFPSLFALYGGAFPIAYLICLIFVCYPLLCAELRFGKGGVRGWSMFAVCAAINCALIALCYGKVCASTFSMLLSLTLGVSAAPASGLALFACGGVALACAAFVLFGGQRRVARFGKISVMSALSAFSLVACVSLIRGLASFPPVELSAFARGAMWADCLGQCLLSLSLAGGVMPTFAKGLDGNFSVTKTAAKIIAANVAGCALSSVCAFSGGFSQSDLLTAGGGVTLALGLYPRAISLVFRGGVAARLISVLFFSAVFTVSVQSACCLFSPAISLPPEKRRPLAIAALIALSLCLIPLLEAWNGAVFAAADRTACSVNAVILAFWECIIALSPHNRGMMKECGKAVRALLAAICLPACGALALLGVSAARFFPSPPAVAAAAACVTAVFYLPAREFLRGLRAKLRKRGRF